MSSPGDLDADAIRNKRLARLSAFQQRPAPPEGINDTPSTSARPLDSSSELSRSPTMQRAATPSTNPPKPPTSSPRRSESTASQPTKVTTASDGLSTQEAWEDRTLAHIFRATLRSSQRAISDRYLILDDLRNDLESELPDDGSKVARLSIDNLDQIILAICLSGKITPMDHLIGSWRRSMKLQRDTPASRLDQTKRHILEEARRMSMSYALYCITMPDMFEGHQAPVRIDERLLADVNDDKGLPQDVLIELVKKFDEEPDLVAKFQEAFSFLSLQLSTMNMTDNYKPYIHALARIAHIRPLAEIFVDMPEFLRDAEPQHLEKVMLLGPWFRISPLQKEVLNTYFANAKAKAAVSIKEAVYALRVSTQSLQSELHQIITIFCKASDHVRSRILDFFAKVLNANHKRTATRINHAIVASDGFMLNMMAVLTKLCEPFMDSTFSKIDRIEIEYFRRSPKLDIKEETKLNADSDSSDEYYLHNKIEGKNNFITEVFFLAAASHRYGLSGAITSHESLIRDVPDLERHIERLTADRENYLSNPFHLNQIDRTIEKLKIRLDEGIACRFALEALLFDPALGASLLLFKRYQMVWLLRLIDPTHRYPRVVLSLPLPDVPPTAFNYLPEYMVEDIGHSLSFVSNYIPQALVPTQLTELLIFAVTFLRSSSYIQKANVKSKLVEIIFLGIYQGRNERPGYLAELIHGNPFVLKHLMHALMNFYIEIEKHYYEKFTVRYHISKIIQQIWSNKAYRDKLEQESDQNVDFFVRFVALLLNDNTYVLDHALTALVKIHTLQSELQNPGPLTEEERAEKEAELQKNEKDAHSYMQLGNETVAMLNLFTSSIADSFVQPEIVHRLAAMLDYNLDALVGSRCNNLRVSNPDKYRFNPKALLSEIVTVYLNLAGKQSFVEAIAKDGRSYKPQIFDLAIGILKRHSLKAADEIEAIAKLAIAVAEAKRLEEEGELELGEPPDEFLDPLMATLMEDPVILPESKVTIDRQTIKAHLLSDQTDPFNRRPLKIEDVVPNDGLKAQIDAWILERREEARKGREAAVSATTANAEDTMDIDG